MKVLQYVGFNRFPSWCFYKEYKGKEGKAVILFIEPFEESGTSVINDAERIIITYLKLCTESQNPNDFIFIEASMKKDESLRDFSIISLSPKRFKHIENIELYIQ